MTDISAQDRDLITRTILSEAGNDGDSGMSAVANVIKNRTDAGGYGRTPGAVVQKAGAFEPWSLPKSDPNHPSRWSAKNDDYKRAGAIVDSVWKGDAPDATGGATHFFSPSDQAAKRRPVPDWANGKPMATVGHHQFFAPEGAVVPDLLGSWGKSSAPSPAVAAAGDEDDLLGSWGKTAQVAAKPASQASAAVGGAMMPVPLPPHDETLGETVARMTGEAQGDTFTDMAKRLGLGALRGVGDVADTLAQGIGYVGEKGARALQGGGVISPESARSVSDWRSRIDADIARENAAFGAAKGDGWASDVGRVGGQIVGTGPFLSAGGAALTAATRGAPIVNALVARPLLSAALRGAGTGAGATALTSAASDQPFGEQIQGGALTGGLLGPVGAGVGRLGSRLLGSHIDRETANLAATAQNKFDIPLRADQVSANPMVRFMGSVMQRLPFTGLGEHVAEQQTAFNRAIANEFGENADKITRPVIDNAKQRIGQTFEDVATRTGSIQIDRPFVGDVVRIVNDARSVLGKDAVPIEAQARRIADRIDYGTDTLDAKSYQSLTRKDTPLDRAMKSADPNVRHYAGQLREALDDAMERSAPPDVVHDLREARYQWAVMKAVEPLAKKAPTGDISPALLLGKSKGGNLEELGQIGQRFLKEPPSSGTSERLAVMKLGAGLAAGAAGLGGAAYFDPENFQRHAAQLGAAALGAKLGGSALKSNLLTGALLNRASRVPSGRNALRLTVGPRLGALMNRPTGTEGP
jgi:Cell Wall Hydrolase